MANHRDLEYEDDRGRLYLVRLPADAPDSDAASGIVIGPPDVVDELDLPEPFATRLHNELFRRKLFTLADLNRSKSPVRAALQKALRVDELAICRMFVQLATESDADGNRPT